MTYLAANINPFIFIFSDVMVKDTVYKVKIPSNAIRVVFSLKMHI